MTGTLPCEVITLRAQLADRDRRLRAQLADRDRRLGDLAPLDAAARRYREALLALDGARRSGAPITLAMVHEIEAGRRAVLDAARGSK